MLFMGRHVPNEFAFDPKEFAFDPVDAEEIIALLEGALGGNQPRDLPPPGIYQPFNPEMGKPIPPWTPYSGSPRL